MFGLGIVFVCIYIERFLDLIWLKWSSRVKRANLAPVVFGGHWKVLSLFKTMHHCSRHTQILHVGRGYSDLIKWLNWMSEWTENGSTTVWIANMHLGFWGWNASKKLEGGFGELHTGFKMSASITCFFLSNAQFNTLLIDIQNIPGVRNCPYITVLANHGDCP